MISIPENVCKNLNFKILYKKKKIPNLNSNFVEIFLFKQTN